MGIMPNGINGNQIDFSLAKCDNSQFTTGGTIYLKEGGICGTNVASGSIPNGSYGVHHEHTMTHTSGTRYYYWVFQSNNGARYYAGPVSVTAVTGSPPSTPSNFTASASSSSSVFLDWNAVGGASSYQIYSCSGSYIGQTSSSQYTVTGLSSGSYYSFKVRAVNSYGSSGFTSCRSAVTNGSPPSVPSNFTVQASSSSSIYLDWNAVSGAISYQIYTCSGSYVGQTSSSQFTVTGLSPNTFYSYQVRSVNSHGSSGFTTCRGAMTDGAPPGVPSGFSAQATSSSSVFLDWNAVSGATNYQVYSCAGSFIANTNSSQYTVSGLSDGTTYSYKVRAVNSSGNSSFSSCRNATTHQDFVLTISGQQPSPSMGVRGHQQFAFQASVPNASSFNNLQVSIEFLAPDGNPYTQNMSNSGNGNFTRTQTLQQVGYYEIRYKATATGESPAYYGYYTVGVTTIDGCLSTEFELDADMSHLHWSFNNSSWDIRNGWNGGEEGGASGGCGWGCGAHWGSDYYADDWNNSLSSDCGEDFLSPLSGIVVYAGCRGDCNDTGYGRQVVIQSDIDPDYAFRITHLSSINVAKDAIVTIGQKLGEVGNSGTVSCHGHAVLYKNIYNNINGSSFLSQVMEGRGPGVVSGTGANQFAAKFKIDAIPCGSGGGVVTDFDNDGIGDNCDAQPGTPNPQNLSWLNQGNVLTPGVYQAQSTINTASDIEQNSLVVLKAGTSIRFLPGFHAKPESRVHASIAHCPPTGSALESASTTEEEGLSEKKIRDPLDSDFTAREMAPLQLFIAPNPFSSELRVSYQFPRPVNSARLLVSHLSTGKMLATKGIADPDVGQDEWVFNSADWPAGMYAIVLQTDQGVYSAKAVLIRD